VADQEDGERLRLVRHHTEYHRHDREARLPDGLVDLLGHRNGARQGEDRADCRENDLGTRT
jgi:hypothetical protein